MFLNKSSIEEIIVSLLILGINAGVGITFLIIGYTGNIGKISLGEFLLRYYILIIYTLFFLLLLLYVIINSLVNVKKKEEVLLCKGIKGSTYLFVDKEGKVYKYYDVDNVEVNKYYKAIKTKDYIVSIQEETIKEFEFNGFKESFWLTFYTPLGVYKNVSYIPLIYVLFIMFLPSIIPSLFIILIIIYDLYVKVNVFKRQKSLLSQSIDYNYDDYINIENEITSKSIPFISKISCFYRDHQVIVIILFIILVICFCYFFLWK